MLHAEAFLSSTRIACGFFSMRIKTARQTGGLFMPYKGILPICASRRCFHFVQVTIFATFAAPQGAFVLLATLKRVLIFSDTQLV